MRTIAARPAIAAISAFVVLLVAVGVAYALAGGTSDSSRGANVPSSAAAVIATAIQPPAAIPPPASAVPLSVTPASLAATAAPAAAAGATSAPLPPPLTLPSVVLSPAPSPAAIGGGCTSGELTAEALAGRGAASLSVFPGGVTAAPARIYLLGTQIYVRGANGCYSSPSAQVVAICTDGAVLIQAEPDCGTHGGLSRKVDPRGR